MPYVIGVMLALLTALLLKATGFDRDRAVYPLLLIVIAQRDPSKNIATGPDVPLDSWPLKRQPLLLEGSLPGVFAAGEVRHGSVKRIAAAVGEGFVTIGSVHQYLSEVAARVTQLPSPSP